MDKLQRNVRSRPSIVRVGIIVALLATAVVIFYFWRGSKIEEWTWKLSRRFFLNCAVR